MPLIRGWTYDGLEYDLAWVKGIGLQCQFLDKRKEVWNFLDIKVDCDEQICVVYVGTLPWTETSSFTDALNVLVSDQFVGSVGYRLEHDGSRVVRGRNVRAQPIIAEGTEVQTPFGRTKLVLGLQISKAPIVQAAYRRVREQEAVRAPPAIVQKPAVLKLPKVPQEQIGLGREGVTRLKVLLDSTLAKMGIKASNTVRVQGIEVIYQLESKYKGTPRDEAVERAILELLNWIENNAYFAG